MAWTPVQRCIIFVMLVFTCAVQVVAKCSHQPHQVLKLLESVRGVDQRTTTKDVRNVTLNRTTLASKDSPARCLPT
jgi:hypothetical protein